MSSAARESPTADRRRGRAPRRLHVALVLLASFAAFVGIAVWVFSKALPAWNTSETNVARVHHARALATPGPPIARRLVWVVVDGLTYDVAASTETLVPIADAGVLRPMVAAFPTFTAGGITSMFTGQSPRESGVRLNGAAVGVEGLDDVLHTGAAGGAKIAVRGEEYADFIPLARPPEGASTSLDRKNLLVDVGAWQPDVDGPPEIVAIHFGDTDDRGHDFGWDSSEYRAAALDAGVFLQQVIAHLDRERDVLVAVSDHGHRADAGHGGVEPDVRRAFFLAWGASIHRGVVLPERPLRDVASTVSVLVGAHSPSSNMGAPMLDILDVSPARRAALLVEPFDQLVAYDCAQAPDLAACADARVARGSLLEGDDAEANRVVGALTSGLDARRDAEQSSASTGRAVVACLVGFALLALGARSRPSRAASLVLPVVTIGPYVALLLAMGYLPTFSKMTATHVFAGDAAWAAALPLPLVAFVAARHRLGLREVLWLEAVGLTITVPLLIWAGADPRRTFDPLAGILVFQLSPIALLTAVAGAVILVTSALRRRARRRRADEPQRQ